MKKTRYAIAQVSDKQYLSFKTNNEENPNYVLAPYIVVDSTKGNIEYDEFMDQYYLDHKKCPKCLATSHMSTLMGFVLDLSKKEEYKDKNKCTCENCGDIHITHDRVK